MKNTSIKGGICFREISNHRNICLAYYPLDIFSLFIHGLCSCEVNNNKFTLSPRLAKNAFEKILGVVDKISHLKVTMQSPDKVTRTKKIFSICQLVKVA